MTAGLPALVPFAAALLLLILGHIMRLARWSLLMGQIGSPKLGKGFMALSLGYVINAIVPLRLGEVVRGLYYARQVRSDPAFVLATIIVERTLDLVAVGAITLACVAAGVFLGDSILVDVILTFSIAAAIVLAALATSRGSRFRRGVWLATSIFNPGIRQFLLHILWSTLEVFREGRTKWRPIALQSLVMWALYISSFALLAFALRITLQQVFSASLGTPLLPMIIPLTQQGGTAALGLFVYSFAPFLIFLAYVGVKQRLGVSVWGAVSWIAEPRLYAGGVPRSASRFVEREHYGDFLGRRFQGTADLVADFEDHAIRDIVVQKMLRGGSDALTVMVQIRDQLCIRKYATGDAARKLEAQCVWLQSHSNILPTVRVLESVRTEQRFLYDMEYSTTSRDLFDMVHMSEVRTSWATLESVMTAMSALYAHSRSDDASEACMARYAEEKVANNLRTIKAAHPAFFVNDCVVVNGVEVSLPLLDRFAEPEFLPSRLRRRGTAVIHGDLTIENILTDPVRADGWFLIDPNIGNVFESPLLDFAKLMQSLHLGYESLNRDLSCSFAGNLLAFPNTRSAQYAQLYDHMVGWLRETVGEDGLRETRLHEIVHYFRLTPYKFRKSKEAGLIFLGCLCLLVKQYFDDYETC